MDSLKAQNLLIKAYNAYEASKLDRLNVPVDMAQFALTEKVTPQVTTYLCATLLFTGKQRITDRPARTIANYLSITERTVYRHFEWLLDRNWMGKDEKNGWYFFRGIDDVRKAEGFKHRRSARMIEADFKTVKEFFTGAVLNSICKTRNERTERKQGRSQQSFTPISLTTLEKVFSISRKTAFTYRKNSGGKYYLMLQNLKQVSCIQPVDVHRLKGSHIDSVTLRLFGSTDTVTAKPEQLRTHFGNVFVQLPNLIKPMMMISKRTR